MELRHIRSFLSIAGTLHFGRTAELIHLSQPALSLQIRALEEEVGVRLFERNRRKTTLTAAGAAFRDDAAAALSQLEQAIRSARLAASGKRGLLRIGFISTAGLELVGDIVRQFRELNPEVEFSLRNILTAQQVQMLEAGALDIGFLRLQSARSRPSMSSPCIGNRSYSWCPRRISWQKGRGCACAKWRVRTS